jgi:serine/threonine protein kinase
LGSALRYLHLDWEQCVVHGDIKPSNIMLDSSYNTKLGDFGLARLVDHGIGPQTTSIIRGSAGYMDPEFVNMRRRSNESDVYSFGIVLLEIISGRLPVNRQEPAFMLPKWVLGLHNQNLILEAADARLRTGDGASERQIERALVVGLWCAHPDPVERPSMAQVMHELQSEDARLPALSPHMYRQVVPPSFGVGESGTSGSSLSRARGARSSSATTGVTLSPE